MFSRLPCGHGFPSVVNLKAGPDFAKIYNPELDKLKFQILPFTSVWHQLPVRNQSSKGNCPSRHA